MDKVLNKWLTNPYTRSLLILVFILVFAGTAYFTLVNAQGYYYADAYHSDSGIIDGGLLISGVGVTNGLVVEQGNVGIGVPNPTSTLEVLGQPITLDKFKFTGNTLEHFETSRLNSQVLTYWTSNGYNCKCGGGPTGLDTESRRYAESLNSYTNAFMGTVQEFLGIPTAQAVYDCYPTQASCQADGCNYCFDEGFGCNPAPDPDPFACNVSCSPQGSTTDAVCENRGSPAPDIEIDNISGSCFGTTVKASVKCQYTTDGDVTDFFTKIEFSGSPGINQPLQTTIHNNLVAPDNEPQTCSYVALGHCSTISTRHYINKELLNFKSVVERYFAV